LRNVLGRRKKTEEQDNCVFEREMKRSLDVNQALRLLYAEDDNKGDVISSSTSEEEESGDEDDEVTDPSFVTSVIVSDER